MANKNVIDQLWRFLADTKSLDKGNKNAQKGLKATQKSSVSLTKAMGALGVAFGAREIVNFAGDAVQMAVAAEEVDARFQAVFGTTEDFTRALSEWADMAGVTDTASRDLASSLGNLAQTQGITGDAAEDFALATAKLAGDLASFKDLDPERVFLALNKGLLTTEKEGLKAFDLAISAVEVNSRALTIAMEDGRVEVTKADKAYASLAIAQEQAGKATGDLEKTQDSLANVQRQQRAALKELQEEIGKELLPAYTKFLKASIKLLPLVEDIGKPIGDLADGLGGLATAVDAVASGFGLLGDRAEDAAGPIFTLGGFLRSMSNPAQLFSDTVFGAADAVDELASASRTGKTTLYQYQQELGDYVAIAIGAKAATGELADGFDGLNKNKLTNEFLSGIDKLLALANLATTGSIVGGGGTGGGDLSGPIFNAQGGTIQPGQTSLVGEHGPELITPRGGAHITPAHRSGGGSGGGVTINVNGLVTDPQGTAEAIVEAIRLYEQTNGPI